MEPEIKGEIEGGRTGMGRGGNLCYYLIKGEMA